MSVNVQIFEETGAIAGGRGSVVTEITNLNWKKTSDPTAVYYLNPVRRPTYHTDETFSYQRYIFFKVSGTYQYLKNFRILVTPTAAPQADLCQLFYKMTDTYAVPTNTFDGSMLFGIEDDGTLQLNPMISTNSPNLAVSRPKIMGPNQTFYTNYLVTQMRVKYGKVIETSTDARTNEQNVGNTMGLNVQFICDEFE